MKSVIQAITGNYITITGSYTLMATQDQCVHLTDKEHSSTAYKDHQPKDMKQLQKLSAELKNFQCYLYQAIKHNSPEDLNLL